MVFICTSLMTYDVTHLFMCLFVTYVSSLMTYLFTSLAHVLFKNKFIYFYFWLCCVFIAARGLSLVAASGATLRCGVQASHCGGFSCCRAQAVGTWASVVVARRLRSCGSQALELRLSSCGTRA